MAHVRRRDEKVYPAESHSFGMDRRAVLALCGTVATTLAGCGGNADGGGETTSPTTDTSTTTGTDRPALAVESVAAPDSVEIGWFYTVQFTVENRTDSERRLVSPISVRVDGEWEPFMQIEASVPPGTTTIERDLNAPLFLGDYRFRLEDPRATWGIQVTERRLPFGTQFTTPENLHLSVPGGKFVDSYSGAGSNRTLTPPGDRQFLLIRIRYRNPTEESITAPPLGVFHVRTGDETHDVALDDPGRRLTLEPNERREVELPFLVPSSTSVEDIEVRWTPTYRAGKTVAVWLSD